MIHAPVGTTVHIPFATTAVHIVAHHVPYVRFTIVQSVSHVPLIHGYCVLNVVHDAGWVIIDVGVYHRRTKPFLLIQLKAVKNHQTNTLPSTKGTIVFTELPGPPFEKVQMKFGSFTHVLVTRTIWFLTSQLNKLKSPPTKIFPSGCEIIELTELNQDQEKNTHVKVESNTQVVERRASLFLFIPLNHVNDHQTITLPSDCIANECTDQLNNPQVNVSSTAQVVVRRTRYFIFLPLNVVNCHHTIILPSD